MQLKIAFILFHLSCYYRSTISGGTWRPSPSLEWAMWRRVSILLHTDQCMTGLYYIAGKFGEKIPALPSKDGGAIFRVIEFSPEGLWIDKAS